MIDHRIKSMLETCIERPELHAAWLNTLSLLEFTGARKIARSFRRPTDEVLGHLAEEARHARFFAALARRVAGDDANAADPDIDTNQDTDTNKAGHRTLAAASGLLYFHRLDHGIARDARARLDPSSVRTACYYYVTAAIEERALGLYNLYNDLLRAKETGLRLDGVIAEEEGHLAEMHRALKEIDPECQTAMETYRDLEGRLFDSFLAGVERELYSPVRN